MGAPRPCGKGWGAAGAGAVEGASVLGGGAGAVVAGAVPVIAMVGVFVALGSGYAAAREAVRNENTVSGLSQVLLWAFSAGSGAMSLIASEGGL